jgi:hypothetical protein
MSRAAVFGIDDDGFRATVGNFPATRCHAIATWQGFGSSAGVGTHVIPRRGIRRFAVDFGTHSGDGGQDKSAEKNDENDGPAPSGLACPVGLDCLARRASSFLVHCHLRGSTLSENALDGARFLLGAAAAARRL